MRRAIQTDPFTWKPEYNLNVSLIDDQHKKYVEILNLLREGILNKPGKEKISEIFFSLVHYAEHHLIQEEIYFKNYQYPNFAMHKEAHKNFIDRIIKFREDYEHGMDKVCEEMYGFLVDWFENHILKLDKEAFEFLLNKGVK
jgi:hemerythrin